MIRSFKRTIRICKGDALGRGLPIYHIDRRIAELDEDFEDGAHIIYVNAKKQENTELGRLMHDLHCKNAEDMYSRVLAERVRELKETQEGVNQMCREMDQIYSEGEMFGFKKGELKKARETALALAKIGMAVEQIAEIVKMPKQTVLEWL